MISTPLPDLDEVLDEEIDCWDSQLCWDHQAAAALIRKYVRLRSLPGHVLRLDGRTVGYCYYVVDPPLGFIGGLFVLRRAATVQSYGMLLEETVRDLKGTPGLERIECQVFPFNLDPAPLFASHGFRVLERSFMLLDLRSPPPQEVCPAGFQIRAWEERRLAEAARVVHDSYRGAADCELCRDYQTARGCLRYLRTLLSNPGYGCFDRSLSLMALDRSGALAALLVASRIGPETGMIPQVSVLRRFQGLGLGTALLHGCLQRARRGGLRRHSLSVSRANRGAERLYRRIGFRVQKRFCACVWNRESRPGTP